MVRSSHNAPPVDLLGLAIASCFASQAHANPTAPAFYQALFQPQYRLSDGRLLLESPGEPLFPAELVRTSPEAAIVLDASVEVRTAITYATLINVVAVVPVLARRWRI